MGGFGGAGDGFANPLDIFEQFFGGGFATGARSQRTRPMAGDDERYDLILDFNDAVFGTRFDPCPLPVSSPPFFFPFCLLFLSPVPRCLLLIFFNCCSLL